MESQITSEHNVGCLMSQHHQATVNYCILFLKKDVHQDVRTLWLVLPWTVLKNWAHASSSGVGEWDFLRSGEFGRPTHLNIPSQVY